MRKTTGRRSGKTIPVSPQARRTARQLAALVDRATRDLPFEAEPADFLAVRDRLAENDAGRGR